MYVSRRSGISAPPHREGGRRRGLSRRGLDVFVPSSMYVPDERTSLTNEDSHMCCALCDGRSGYPLKWPRFTSDE